MDKEHGVSDLREHMDKEHREGHPYLLVLDAGRPAEDDDGARGLGHEVHIHLPSEFFMLKPGLLPGSP